MIVYAVALMIFGMSSNKHQTLIWTLRDCQFMMLSKSMGPVLVLYSNQRPIKHLDQFCSDRSTGKTVKAVND